LRRLAVLVVVAEIDKRVPLALVLAEAAHGEFFEGGDVMYRRNKILGRLRTTHLHAARSKAAGIEHSQKVLIVPLGRAPLRTNWCHDTTKVSSTIKILRCTLHLLGSESGSIQAADHAHDPECPPRKKQMHSPINN
jgi:hypothetical protein